MKLSYIIRPREEGNELTLDELVNEYLPSISSASVKSPQGARADFNFISRMSLELQALARGDFEKSAVDFTYIARPMLPPSMGVIDAEGMCGWYTHAYFASLYHNWLATIKPAHSWPLKHVVSVFLYYMRDWAMAACYGEGRN